MKNYKVSKSISKNIQSVKDLNDFYAFVERFGDEYEYDFPIEDCERIDSLTDELCYTVGIYDSKNVARIFEIK